MTTQASSRPLVSIIITNYNYALYIKEAIESVLNQSYKNIELIIIDDGSTDNSRTIIEKYSKENKKIRFFYQKNRGAVFARNKGIDESLGDFFIFIDADDKIPVDFIENTVNIALKFEADVVYCDIKKFGVFNDKIIVDAPSIKTISEFSPTPICQLVRRSCLNGVRFDEELNDLAHEDNDFFFTLFLNNVKFIKSKELYLYRIHEDSRNPNSSDTKHYKSLVYILFKHSIHHPELKKTLVSLLEEKDKNIKHWHSIADERLSLISDFERALVEKDLQISDILGSKRYKAGTALLLPALVLRSLSRRIKR